MLSSNKYPFLLFIFVILNKTVTIGNSRKKVFYFFEITFYIFKELSGIKRFEETS